MRVDVFGEVNKSLAKTNCRQLPLPYIVIESAKNIVVIIDHSANLTIGLY